MKVLYFASLREQVGMESEQLAIPDGVADIGGLRAWLAARGGDWSEAFDASRAMMCAVNQVMVKPDAAIAETDEVAFFPPVTGG